MQGQWKVRNVMGSGDEVEVGKVSKGVMRKTLERREVGVMVGMDDEPEELGILSEE